MKLILSSAGLYTKEITDEMVRLVGKPQEEISVAIINEASKVEFGDRRRWFFNELNRIRDNAGGALDMIDLQANSMSVVREQMAFADVIYCIGGNVDYLTKVFYETGFDEVLRELLKTKLYIGSSAGAMVIGTRIKSPTYGEQFRKDKTYGVTEYIGLVDLKIVPHVDSPHFPGRTREVVSAMVSDEENVYLLKDTQALSVDGDEIVMIGV